MKTQNITKTQSTLTTWTNETTGERVQYESDNQCFYFTPKERKSIAMWELSECNRVLALCDASVSHNSHSVWIANNDCITNTSFVSAVLTQFLHKLNTTHNDESHN